MTLRLGFARLALSLVASHGVAACSVDALLPVPDLAPPRTPTLTVTPRGEKLTVDGAMAEQRFTATLDTGEDVTARATWSVDEKDAKKGRFVEPGRFRATWPPVASGPLTVTATYQGLTDSAPLALRLILPDTLDASVPANVAQAFSEAKPKFGPPPEIVYPLDKATIPANHRQLVVQWRDVDHTFTRIHLESECVEASVYLSPARLCSPGAGNELACGYQLPDKLLGLVLEAVRATSGLLNVTVEATAGGGAEVAVSPPITLRVEERLDGAFHWFATGSRSISRALLGGAPVVVARPGQTICGGCHAVSPDGTRLGATFYGADGFGGIVDVPSGNFLLSPWREAMWNSQPQWNFAAFDPTGRLLVTNWKGTLTVRNATDGARKLDIPAQTLGGRAVMPEWSPDGRALVFVQIPPDGRLGSDFPGTMIGAGDFILGNAGHIAVTRLEGDVFQPAQVIVPTVPGKEYHYFPTFSPDGRFIAFVTATAPGRTAAADVLGKGVDTRGWVLSYGQLDARLRLVSADPADRSPPLELTAATQRMGIGPTWPRFVPVVTSHNTAWLSFSTRLPHGFRTTDPPKAQMWLSSIDLTVAAARSSDPSAPPFWLPFQEFQTSNYVAAWSRTAPCRNAGDCGGALSCDAGVCRDGPR